jgi:hypothetical protein
VGINKKVMVAKKRTWEPGGRMIIEDTDTPKSETHVCFKEKELNTLAYNIEGIKGDLTEIKGKLSVVSEIEKAIEIQRGVKDGIEKYKLENNLIEDTKEKKVLARKGISLQTIATITAFLVFLVMFIFQILNYNLNKATKKDVQDLGQPVVVNPKGQIVPLPDGNKLKMYPNDFLKKDSTE